jgi:hypothetical protein
MRHKLPESVRSIMNKIRIVPAVAIGAACLAAFLWVQSRETGSKPPFHDGPALRVEPAPVPPVGDAVAAEDAMALLARPKSYSAARVSSFARDGDHHDVIELPLGGEEMVVADIAGPGAITHIWMTFRDPGRDIVLRFYWEGSDHPSIEAPIGDFFGVAMGIDAPVQAWPIQVSGEGRARNCWWHMPFNRSARITAANVVPPEREGARVIHLYYYVDYRIYRRPIRDIAYLHARFRETDPAERGRMVRLAAIEGRGHFVGVVLGQRARTQGWFGEGDDVITVDGQLSFAGTGTEDYFCDAYGFRTFSALYHGVPVYEGCKIGDRLSAYRFHIADPIPFRKSLVFDIEHWPWFSPWPNTGRDYYSSLAFWYQEGIHAPWPRLERFLSSETWDPAKGRWTVPGALEAEDLAILDSRSLAIEDRSPLPVIGPQIDSRDVLIGLLRYGPRPERVHLMPNLSGDHMLAFDSGGDGAFTLAVPAPEDGLYTVETHLVLGNDYGVVELDIDGRPAGPPADTFFRSGRAVQPPRAFIYENVPLKTGLNPFRFIVRSKNPQSAGHRMAIDCLVLNRTGEAR